MHLNPLDFFLKHIETHGETWEYTVLAVFILRFAGGHDTSIPHMESNLQTSRSPSQCWGSLGGRETLLHQMDLVYRLLQNQVHVARN